MSNLISSAAAQVAEARANAKRACVPVEAAQVEAARVQERINALHADRSAIAHERSNGHHDPAHAGKLALIDLDLEGLAPLMAEANSKLSAAGAAQVRANQEVSVAEDALRRAKAVDLREKLIGHLNALDATMVSTLTELNAVAASLGEGLSFRVWAPSVALDKTLHMLALQRETM
jgi:hypothetical protein